MPEFEWQFTLVLLTNGVMIGLMYALIALGFVLIYKATDAINFAQGEFVMFAGFIAAGAAELAGAPFWVSALALRRRHGAARLRSRTRRVAAADRPAGHRRRDGDDRPRCGAAGHGDIGLWRRHARHRDADRRRADRIGPGHAAAGPGGRGGGQHRLPRRLQLVFPQEPHRHRDARRRRQPAGGDGDGHRRAALFRARLGDGGRRFGARRRRLGNDARGRQPARPGRPQSLSGGDPGRPRIRSSARWSAG